MGASHAVHSQPLPSPCQFAARLDSFFNLENEGECDSPSHLQRSETLPLKKFKVQESRKDILNIPGLTTQNKKSLIYLYLPPGILLRKNS